MHEFSWYHDNQPSADPRFVNMGFRTYYRPNGYGEVRTREDHPYSYSPFILTGWPDDKIEGKKDYSWYSDRMVQNADDHEKWRRLAEKHFKSNSPRFTNLKEMSAFLSDWYGKKIRCYCVIEECNVSNGYPLWYFMAEEE